MMLEPIIGLEIHIQLKTKSKMFCSCGTHDTVAAPNTNVCPICLAHPGTLPVPNEQAVRWAVLAGLALKGKIATVSKFDRKNYFYPDLPKGYQISQYDLPISSGGYIDIPSQKTGLEEKRIFLTRLHLEEDAAKSFHGEDGLTRVDFNRGGTPLAEIVTEPDFRSPQEAKAFLQELRLTARYLNISDADMEKGHMRCDANISLKEIDDNGNPLSDKLSPKTEVKNLNSFKAVERALEYEIIRQTKCWEQGCPPSVSSTRGWNDRAQKTEEQRTKEEAEDYKYFPEPDIPPMMLKEMAEELSMHIGEMPAQRRARFVQEYAVKPEDAWQMCDDPYLSEYVERVFSELNEWIESCETEDLEAIKRQIPKLVSGWLLSKLMGLMGENGINIRILKITPENFAEFIALIATGKLSTKNGLVVLEEMMNDGSDPTHVMEDKRLGRMEDESRIAEAVDNVIRHNPDEVTRYKAGKKELLQFLIGMVMKETEGNADPGTAKNILLVRLESHEEE